MLARPSLTFESLARYSPIHSTPALPSGVLLANFRPKIAPLFAAATARCGDMTDGLALPPHQFTKRMLSSWILRVSDGKCGLQATVWKNSSSDTFGSETRKMRLVGVGAPNPSCFAARAGEVSQSRFEQTQKRTTLGTVTLGRRWTGLG